MIELKKIVYFFCLVFCSVYPSFAQHPFNYDLHLSYTPGINHEVMIAAHGMGGNYTIDEYVKVQKTVVSFNFPDHDFNFKNVRAEKTTFGTVDEILPLLYVIKECVVEQGHQKVDLYGFSAGGGAIINAIAFLNTNRFDDKLMKIGIFQTEKQKMLQAIQEGLIILDAPLKSMEEIIWLRGASKELEIFAKRFKENDMEPIHALKYLNGLSLDVIVHFQNPDEILSNRDDALFFDRLKKININGTTKLIVGRDNGHIIPHPSLWDFIKLN